MGAAQSKKRKKERKRKKKMQMGLNADFDMPRSASADIIRTLSVSAASCPLCRQTSDRRTFSGSLESYHGHHNHVCLRGHYDDMSNTADGYESCPSCSTSTYCLSLPNPAWDIERSTMSLNRNLVGRTSKLAQSKSSEFAELLDILKHHEIQRRTTYSSTSAIKSVQEGRRPHYEEATMSSTAVMATQVKSTKANVESSCSPPSSGTDNSGKVDKKTISILEDEESRQARWERQKLMAQQLRTLRKHIQQQEAAASASKPVVAPFPLVNVAQDVEQLHQKSAAFENSSAAPPDALKSSESRSDPKDPLNISRRGSRSKFSKMSNYRYLDNHPVLSKLQNEQNNRLECMERRMKEIRISAMQEAERRKFAEIFPAKEDNSETERRLQEAREALEKIKAEKRKKREEILKPDEEVLSSTVCDNIFSNTHEGDSRTNEDSGDIIPVHIIPTRGGKSTCRNDNKTLLELKTSKSDGDVKTCDQDSKSHWLNEAWPNINLGNPVTWFLLPFLMFPLILRVLLSLIINTSSPNNGNSNSSVNCSSSGASTSRSSSSSGLDTRQKKP